MHSRIKGSRSVIPVETGIQICPCENGESCENMDSCFRRNDK